MKSVVVVVVGLVCAVIAGCDALDGKLQDEDNSINIPAENVTGDPAEDGTKSNTEDDSTATNASDNLSVTELVTTVRCETTVTPSTPKVTSTPAVDTTTAPAHQKASSTPSGSRKRLSTEVDKSKCESLGIEIPKAEGCKCYKQKSAGTDTPQGYCFYYECPGTPPTLSKHKCEWIKE